MSLITLNAGSTTAGSQHNLSVPLGTVSIDSIGDKVINANLLDLHNAIGIDKLPAKAQSLECNIRVRNKWKGDQAINDNITLTFKYNDGINPPVEIKKVQIVAETDTAVPNQEDFDCVLPVNGGFPDSSSFTVTIEQNVSFELDGDITVSTVGYDS